MRRQSLFLLMLLCVATISGCVRGPVEIYQITSENSNRKDPPEQFADYIGEVLENDFANEDDILSVDVEVKYDNDSKNYIVVLTLTTEKDLSKEAISWYKTLVYNRTGTEDVTIIVNKNTGEDAVDNENAIYSFPDSIVQIKVSHITLFHPQEYLLESDAANEIADIIRWFRGLELVACERPSDVDGNEIYAFEINGETAFEYDRRGGEMDYVIIGENHFEVHNPSIPPCAGNEWLEYDDRSFKRYDLSPEADRWLRWYITLPADEQLTVEDVPAELTSFPSKEEVSSATNEQAKNLLWNKTQKEMHDNWGEPDSFFSGVYGDIYVYNTRFIGIFYDYDSKRIIDVKVGDKE